MVLFGVLSASAQTTLYVDGTIGNDAVSRSSNTAATPWRTIGRAAWGSTNRSSPNSAEAARAGDTVVVASGTYNYSGTVSNRFSAVYNPVNEGTSPSSTITFQASGAVRLTAPSAAAPVIGCHTRNYVIWQGLFQLDEASISITADTGTVVLVGATGCGVNGISVDGDGAPTYVDNHTGVRIELCQSCFVRNSTITDVRHPNGNHNGSGVMLYNSDNSIIENNFIYDVDNAIFIKGVFGVNDPQSGTIIRRNRLENCDECITVSDSQNSRIYQNVIRNAQIGLNLLARESGAYYHPVGDWFVNNTVYNMTSTCIYLGGSSIYENVRVWNNILTNCNVANLRESTTFPSGNSVVDWEHNNYSGFTTFADDTANGTYTISLWKSTFAQDSAAPAGSTSDPVHVNAAGGDFRLCTGVGAPVSTCTGASPVSALAIDVLDLDGDGSTSDTVRAGAYVNNNEVIGLLAPGLGAPTGLRITTGS